MTENKTYKYTPEGYCIELSKMLRVQERDPVKFDKLFIDLYIHTGSDKYIAEWMRDNDPLYMRFMRGPTILYRQFGVDIRAALRICYDVHCEMDKEIFTSNEKYWEEQQRKLFVSKREAEPTKPRGARERLRRFFKRG